MSPKRAGYNREYYLAHRVEMLALEAIKYHSDPAHRERKKLAAWRQRAREKMDPAKMERIRERARAYYHRKMQDPEYREKKRLANAERARKPLYREKQKAYRDKNHVRLRQLENRRRARKRNAATRAERRSLIRIGKKMVAAWDIIKRICTQVRISPEEQLLCLETQGWVEAKRELLSTKRLLRARRVQRAALELPTAGSTAPPISGTSARR